MDSLTQLSTLENLSNVCVRMLSRVHGIFQARILECVVISSSRGSSQLRNWTCISCVSRMAGRLFIHWTTVESAWILTQLQSYLWSRFALVYLWAGLVTVVAFVIAKYVKGSKGPLLADWLDKLWYVHRMESSPALFLMGYFLCVDMKNPPNKPVS